VSGPAGRSLEDVLRAGLPPAEARSLVEAVVPTDPGDDGRPSPRRTGRRHLEAILLEAEDDPAAALDAYRQVLDHHELYRAPFLLADCHQGVARCLLDRWPGWRRDEAAALLLRRLGHGPTPTQRPTQSPSPRTRGRHRYQWALVSACWLVPLLGVPLLNRG
jgi:hypothetical protein